MEKTKKEKFIDFVDRRKHPLDKNLRLTSILLVTVMIISVFLPFLGVTAGVSFSAGEKVGEIPIFQPTSSVVEFSTGDLIAHNTIDDIEIFGQRIGDVEVLGLNLYNLATTPFPKFDFLTQANSFLSSDTLSFLVSDNFVEFCTNNLGDFGQTVVDIGQTIYDLSGQAQDVLQKVTAVLTGLSKASDGLRATVSTVNGYLNIADNVVIFLLILILAAFVLFIINKGPRLLPAIALTVFSVIYLAVGIGVAIANSAIAGAINGALQDLSASIFDIINSFIPGGTSVISAIVPLDQVKLNCNVNIFCGAGWWLMFLPLVAATVLAYITPMFERKRLATEAVETTEVTAEAVEEIETKEESND